MLIPVYLRMHWKYKYMVLLYIVFSAFLSDSPSNFASLW